MHLGCDWDPSWWQYGWILLLMGKLSDGYSTSYLQKRDETSVSLMILLNYFSPSTILLNTAICCTKVSCFMSSALMLELLGTGIAEKAHSYASKGPGLCLRGRWISKHTLRVTWGVPHHQHFWSVWIIGIFPKMWSCPNANPQAMSWAREFTKMVVVQKDQGKGYFLHKFIGHYEAKAIVWAMLRLQRFEQFHIKSCSCLLPYSNLSPIYWSVITPLLATPLTVLSFWTPISGKLTVVEQWPKPCCI